MAVDVCSEICSSIVVSPRISFSHDLNNHQTDGVQIEHQYKHRSEMSLVDSNSDFHFCLSDQCFLQEPSSADELFHNGKIIPTEIKNKKVITIKNSLQSQPTQFSPQPDKTIPTNTITSTSENSRKKSLKEFLATSCEEEETLSSTSSSTAKTFWQFRRSSSLNCDSARSKSLIRPFQFLSRSNSTGSAPNSKQSILPKNNQKQNLQKQASTGSEKSSVPCSFSAYYPYSSLHKPPLVQRNQRSSGGNGVRISPVLNIPPHYSSKGSVSLFGFGSIFCTSKKRKNKKR